MKCACKQLWRVGRWLALILIVIAAYFALHYWFWLKQAHPVVKGELYRSAQLTPREFAKAIQQYHIKSILNLRGNVHASWYQEERDFARKTNIPHYDLQMSSYQLPTKERLIELVRILEESPKPLLVHCEGGADRSGFASAIYLILQNRSLKEAQGEYSLRYFVIYDNSVGKLVMPRYEKWLEQHHLNSSRNNFLTWLAQYS